MEPPDPIYDDTERMAAIGRAVVGHLMPGNAWALREATPELVVGRLRREHAERVALETSDALRVGRLAIDLWTALGEIGRRR